MVFYFDGIRVYLSKKKVKEFDISFSFFLNLVEIYKLNEKENTLTKDFYKQYWPALAAAIYRAGTIFSGYATPAALLLKCGRTLEHFLGRTGCGKILHEKILSGKYTREELLKDFIKACVVHEVTSEEHDEITKQQKLMPDATWQDHYRAAGIILVSRPESGVNYRTPDGLFEDKHDGAEFYNITNTCFYRRCYEGFAKGTWSIERKPQASGIEYQNNLVEMVA